MTLEELTKEIETQYNLFHQTKIKITLPEEIKTYEIGMEEYNDYTNKWNLIDIDGITVDNKNTRITLNS